MSVALVCVAFSWTGFDQRLTIGLLGAIAAEGIIVTGGMASRLPRVLPAFYLIALGLVLNVLMHDTPYRGLAALTSLLISVVTLHVGYVIGLELIDSWVPALVPLLTVAGIFTFLVVASGTDPVGAAARLISTTETRPFLREVFRNGADRAGEMFGYARLSDNVRNHLASVVVIILGLGLLQRRRRHRLVIVATAAVLVLFSLSRSAWLAAAVPFVALFCRRLVVLFRRRNLSISTVVATALVLAATPLLLPFVVARLSGASDESEAVRSGAALDALQILSRDPLLGAAVRREASTPPHNLVLEAGLTGGLLGMVGAAWLFVVVAKWTWRAARQIVTSPDQMHVRFGLAAATIGSVAVVRMLTSGDALRDLPLWLSAGLVLGMAPRLVPSKRRLGLRRGNAARGTLVWSSSDRWRGTAARGGPAPRRGASMTR